MSAPYFNLTTGIVAAKSDAHHDFGKAYKAKLVDEELPAQALASQTKFMSEDKFMNEYIVKSGGDPLKLKQYETLRSVVPAQSQEAIAPMLHDDIANEYTVVSYRNGKANEKEKETEAISDSDAAGGSALQEILNEQGVIDDVFIICDVAYSWIRKDLRKAKRDNNQIFWWTQVLQTGFDPAGKTAWHTGKELGFQDPDSGFRFCWQPAIDGVMPKQEYVEWPTNDAGDFADAVGSDDRNAMICLNKKLMMLSEAEDGNEQNYKSHKSYLMVFNEKKRKYVYASKEMAAKEYKMSNNKTVMASYYNKAKALLRRCLNLMRINTELEEADKYSLQYQMLAKRCGDMPQALACLNKDIKFQTFVQTPNGYKPGLPNDLAANVSRKKMIVAEGDENGEGRIFQTNGNNMFVSYDRIAVAQALNYRVPIVAYDQKLGMTLFIAKRLRSPLNKLRSMFAEVEEQQEGTPLFVYNYQDFDYKFKMNVVPNLNKAFDEQFIQELNTKLKSLATAVVDYGKPGGTFDDAVGDLTELGITNDEEYRNYLTSFLNKLALIRILETVGEEVATFDQALASINEQLSLASGKNMTIFGAQEYNSSLLQEAINTIFSRYVVDGKLKDLDGLVNDVNSLTVAFDSFSKKVISLNEQHTLLYELVMMNMAGTQPVQNNLLKNVRDLSPATPGDRRVNARSGDIAVYNASESVLGFHAVVKPIVDVLVSVRSNPRFRNLTDSFYTHMMGYTSALLANKDTLFNGYQVYSMLYERSKVELDKIIAPLAPNAQSGGRELGKRGRFDEDDEDDISPVDTMMPQVPRDDLWTMATEPVSRPRQRMRIEEAPEVSMKMELDIYSLCAAMAQISNSTANVQEIVNDRAKFANLIEFDGLLKNIFNCLTAYFIHIDQHEQTDTLSNYGFFQLFSTIGQTYLRINQYDLSENDEDMEENDGEEENLYLFNALDSQLMSSNVTLAGNNAVRLLSLYLNQAGFDGPALYPAEENELNLLEMELPNLLQALSQVNLGKAGELMSGVYDLMYTDTSEEQVDVKQEQQNMVGDELKDEAMSPRSVIVGGTRKKRSRLRKNKTRRHNK